MCSLLHSAASIRIVTALLSLAPDGGVVLTDPTEWGFSGVGDCSVLPELLTHVDHVIKWCSGFNQC